MKRNMRNLPRLTMAISALLFGSLMLVPPKASAAVEIFLTINGVSSPVHQVSASSLIVYAIETAASIVVQ